MLFHPGDVVRVAGSSPLATIDFDDLNSQAEVACIWIDSEGRLQRVLFPVAKLEKVGSLQPSPFDCRMGLVVRLTGSDISMTVMGSIRDPTDDSDILQCCWRDSRHQIRIGEFKASLVTVVNQESDVCSSLS